MAAHHPHTCKHKGSRRRYDLNCRRCVTLLRNQERATVLEYRKRYGNS